MPDIRLTGEPGRLYEVLRSGRFVLPAPPGDPAGPAGGQVVRATPVSTRLPVMLIRPDGYIAWATDDGNPVSRDLGLREVLAAWCTAGPPVPARVIGHHVGS